MAFLRENSRPKTRPKILATAAAAHCILLVSWSERRAPALRRVLAAGGPRYVENREVAVVMVTQRRLGAGLVLVLVAILGISSCHVADFSGVSMSSMYTRVPTPGVDPCAHVRGTSEPVAESHSRLALVTGGAGFIGSSLCPLLLTLGYRVRVLDNLSTGFSDFVPPGAEFVNGDVRDLAAVRDAMRGVGVVFHLAAMSKVEPSLTDPAAIAFCLDVNVRGTTNVMEAARSASRETDAIGTDAASASRTPNAASRTPIKVIYAASSTYYGNQVTPFSEGMPEVLSSPYAHSKRSGEAVVLLYGRLHGVPVVSLRLFMVYGKNQPKDGAYKVVTGSFLKALSDQRPLLIEGDGTQYRDFVHVTDVARAFVLAAQNEAVDGVAINVGTGVATSIKAVADLVSAKQEFVEKRKNDLRGTLADTCLAKKTLGFEARRQFGEEMKKAVQGGEG